MNARSDAPHGPLRRIAAALLGLLQTRLELVGVELLEEKNRFLSTLFSGLAAAVFGALALFTLTALIAVLCWDTYRWQALAVMGAVYALACIALVLRARQGLRNAPMPFEATLAEFEQDRDLLRKP